MKHRKKALWALLSAIILMVVNSTIVGIVRASPTKVSVDYFGMSKIFDTEMGPGTEFTVNLTVDYIEELWGYQFALRFNPAVLNIISYMNGPFLTSAGGRALWIPGEGFNNTEGTLGLFGAALYPKLKFPTGGGVLAYVTFQVVDYGESPIKLDVNTGLSNKTGGWDFNGETLRYPENPSAFVDGYFDNRPPMFVSPSRVIGVTVGKSFSINISVADMRDVSSWSFYMNWTATLLNVTSVTEGDFGSFLYEINNDAGYVHIASSTVVTGSGTLANITFLVKNSGKSNLTLYDTEMLNSASEPIPIRTENGFFDNIVHDISIIDVTPDPTRVKAGSGETVDINVTLKNIGAFRETGINVTVFYNGNETGKQTEISLELGEVKILQFMWNTTGTPQGKYKIKAVASPVVNETDTADNTYSYRGGWVTIFMRNIAVTSVTTPISKVFSGYHVFITVIVENKGTEIEYFNVTTYYADDVENGHKIDTQAVNELGYLESRTLKFMWNITADIALGNYTIWAEASHVNDETNLTDNKLFKVGKLQILVFEEEFPTELAALTIAAVVITGSVIFFVRRRKPPEEEAELYEEFRH